MKTFSPTRMIKKLTRKKGVMLPRKIVEQSVKERGGHKWFMYSFIDRPQRWESWQTCYWIHDECSEDVRILETGCGAAVNLLWLAQHGFKNLCGFDIDQTSIQIASDINESINKKITLWCDDGRMPHHMPGDPFDVVLLLNWLMLTECDLPTVLLVYAQYVSSGAQLFLDVIDKSFNQVPLNQFLTSDWRKPERERQPSEYKSRFSQSEVEYAAKKAGFVVEECWMRDQILPRRVYRLRRL